MQTRHTLSLSRLAVREMVFFINMIPFCSFSPKLRKYVFKTLNLALTTRIFVNAKYFKNYISEKGHTIIRVKTEIKQF